MSDEDIIKKRLLIDGDGTGDDRRLNLLLRTFLKWTFSKNDTPESNQLMYDRLMSQLEQCKFAAAKSERTLEMIEEEKKNYAKLNEHIEKCIVMAKKEIEEKKRELVVAKQIRKNKMQYDMLAKKIKEQPDRAETVKEIDELEKELCDLEAKETKLERKFQKRRNDFTVLMYALKELEASLEDSSSDSSKSDDEDLMDAVKVSSEAEDSPTTSKAISKSFKSIVHTNGSEENKETLICEPMAVDEDAVLELSIEKDENDEKMIETAVADS